MNALLDDLRDFCEGNSSFDECNYIFLFNN